MWPEQILAARYRPVMQISDLIQDHYAKQFYLTADGHKAFIDYSLGNGQYQLLYSEVPAALRGRGIGKVLVERTFEAIKAEGKTAVAKCGFVRHVARESGQWNDVIHY
jgi:predicted GNAT family acetyltransferase